MKKKINPFKNNEIDVISLLKVIWTGKIKIILITITFYLIGHLYFTQLPKNYLLSLTINKSNDHKLLYLNSINTMLLSTFGNERVIADYNQSQTNSNQEILKNFVDELNDYNELLLSLKKTKTIKEKLINLDIEDQRAELFKYSNSFEIIETKKKKEEFNDKYIINFVWNDIQEAKNILQNTLDLTLINLEKSIFERLITKLENIKKFRVNQDDQRLEFLQEQSSIAKEIGIVDSQIDKVNFSQSSVLFKITTTDNAYYMRGSKAIDKEIELIQNRNYSVFKSIEDEINSLKKNSVNWIDYNIYLTKVKSLENNRLILVTSILLGLIAGIFYVLVFNALKSKNNIFNKTF